MSDEKDTKLATALRQAKQNPMFFAFVAKGSSDGVLIVSKKKIAVKEINEAKAELGGKAVFRGRCFGENGKMVFQIAKEPPSTLAKQLKTVIHESAGMMMPVETRIAADLEEETEESESEGAEIPEAPPLPGQVPPPPAPTQGGAAAVTKRLNALTGDIKAALAGPDKARVQTLFVTVNGLIKNSDFVQAGKVLDELEPLVAPSKPIPAPPQGGASVTGRLNAIAAAIKAALKGPDGSRVQALFVAVNGLIKSGDFAQAGKVLDELEPLAQKGLTPQPAPTAPPPTAPPPTAPPPTAPSAQQVPANEADLQAEWERRVIAIEPRVLEAQKKRAGEAKWMTMFMSVQDLGSEGKLAQALDLLNRLEGMLNAPPKTAQNDAGKEGTFVKLQSSRLQWDQTRKSVAAELQTLEKAILDDCKVINEDPDEEFEIDLGELAGKTKQLYTIMEKLDERLIDKLDEALNAKTKELRDQKQKEAVDIIKQYQATVNSDPLVAAIDESGFVSTSIKRTFANVLNDLASKL